MPYLGPEGQRMWRVAGIYSAVGIEMALAVGLGTFGGVAIDERLSIAPWGALVGFGIGVGAAVLAIWRALRLGQRAMAARDDAEDDV